MKEKADSIVLIYTGAGFLPGIPARDLTADEAKAHGGIDYLISTGLYRPVEAKTK
jgi:hypothetical protein